MKIPEGSHLLCSKQVNRFFWYTINMALANIQMRLKSHPQVALGDDLVPRKLGLSV